MKCRDAHEMLNSYFDNKIDPMKDKLLAEHIRTCPECRAEYDFMTEYRNILKTVKPVPAPDNFLSALHSRIELETKDSIIKKVLSTIRYGINSFNFPVEAAGVLAIALMVFFLYRPFFNEKIQEKSSEFAVESPREERTPLKKIEKSESAGKAASSDKFTAEYNIMREKTDLPSGKITAKEETPVYETADDNLSAKSESTYGSQDISDMKKSRSAESEKKTAADEEKSFSIESDAAKVEVLKQKDTPSVSASTPENIFIKYNVTVIKKDLSSGKTAYYRVRVNPSKFDNLIKDLKKDFTVEMKIISRKKTFYEIELFMKRK